MSDLPELYISADSQVVEPKELWLTRMDRRFAFFNRSGRTYGKLLWRNGAGCRRRGRQSQCDDRRFSQFNRAADFEAKRHGLQRVRVESYQGLGLSLHNTPARHDGAVPLARKNVE